MSRIKNTFDRLRSQGRKALIPFVTAGDPSPAITVPLMHAMVEAGVDVIELDGDPRAMALTLDADRVRVQPTTLESELELDSDRFPDRSAAGDEQRTTRG